MGVLVGLACGTVNGILIAKKRLAPFIVTLGMMTDRACGVALVYTNGRPVINLSDSYDEIGGGSLSSAYPPIPPSFSLGVVVLGCVHPDISRVSAVTSLRRGRK